MRNSIGPRTGISATSQTDWFFGRGKEKENKKKNKKKKKKYKQIDGKYDSLQLLQLFKITLPPAIYFFAILSKHQINYTLHT